MSASYTIRLAIDMDATSDTDIITQADNLARAARNALGIDVRCDMITDQNGETIA